MAIAEKPLVLSSQQHSALHKLQKYRKLHLGADGYWRAEGRCWWSLGDKVIRQLVARDLARITKADGATFVILDQRETAGEA